MPPPQMEGISHENCYKTRTIRRFVPTNGPWLAPGDARTSRPALAAIDDAHQSGRGLAISDVTLREKPSFRIADGSSSRSALNLSLQVEQRLKVFPISVHIATQAFELSERYPNDPVERLIAATALIEDLPLLTADQNIRRSRAVPTIWSRSRGKEAVNCSLRPSQA